ncbi:Flp1 family type IVb pilin [Aureibacillus halotolerans]|uniref:Putative flagellin with Flp1-like domain n=1 Tax=Aureibacillus halotolerans TaxID=1508390 RepID=A0A4V3D616_9BACI|nr:Flp1 family type IVb pilin [Aureibacillus halotolerans]TDQ42197.1 putative flagellin with Flp1-like domain [Aureibacillus halotolerans]
MKNAWTAVKNFWNDEEGLGTLEILLIIAVLIAVAVMFRTQLEQWVRSIIDANTGQIDSIIEGGGGGGE